MALYDERNRARQTDNDSVSVWYWLLGALIVGAILLFVFMRVANDVPSSRVDTKPAQTVPAPNPAPATKP